VYKQRMQICCSRKTSNTNGHHVKLKHTPNAQTHSSMQLRQTSVPILDIFGLASFSRANQERFAG